LGGKLRGLWDVALPGTSDEDGLACVKPSTRDRLARLESDVRGSASGNGTPPIRLLEHRSSLEEAALSLRLGVTCYDALERLEWDEVGSKVTMRQISSCDRSRFRCLSGVFPESLPELAQRGKVVETMPGKEIWKLVPVGNDPGIDGFVIYAALAMLLVRKGGRLECLPGRLQTVRLNGQAIHVASTMNWLCTGTLSAADWLRQCAEVGILGADLGAVVERRDW
jgi:hypothetical protein